MPAITNLSFSITSSDFTNVTLDVAYTVQRSALERFLGEHGLGFDERIQIVGDDPGEVTDQVLHTFPAEVVVFAPGELVASRSRRITVRRSSLNEDPGTRPSLNPGQFFPSLPNPDQLFARVEVRYVGLDTVRVSSDSEVRTLTVV